MCVICARAWSAFECVCVAPGSWRLQYCGHPELLVKLHLHQNHRPLHQTSSSSSQPASTSANNQTQPAAALLLLFTFLLFLFAFLNFHELNFGQSVRGDFWFCSAKSTHTKASKSGQTKTGWGLMVNVQFRKLGKHCVKWLNKKNLMPAVKRFWPTARAKR